MARERFAFGPFLLDTGREALFEHGLPVAIGGRALALLRALVEARGQVVAKSALMDAAWPDTSVEESNLTVQIAALRGRLRASPDAEEWIVTFPRVGYRFAGPLSVEQHEAPTSHARPPALGPKPSIAVLPFTSMSGDPEQAHFADGLAEDLATDLSKLPGLQVIPPNSSFVGTAGPTDIRSATRGLGVRYVIGGSVRRAAGRVRIGVQLTEPAMNRHLWAERFDGDLADVFSLQDEVVGKIVAALANVLPLAPPATRRRTTDIEAHDFLVRGRVLLMHSPGGNNLARTLLAKAIALDPASAEAHACLAISHYGAAVNYGEAAEANRVLGLACARKAVSLDPNDPSAHRALGYVRLYAGELEEAEAEWQTALRIKPNHADILANMADLRILQGRPGDAVAWVEKALRLNPYPAGWYYWTLGFAYYAAGRYAEAADALRKEEVGRLPAKRILAASLAQLGRMDEACEEARRFLEINPGFLAYRWAATQPFNRHEDRQHFVDGYLKAGLPR
jgi:TolB-like protein/Tfp pilus assembly protein PilF